MSETQNDIHARMLANSGFTFGSLHAGLHYEAYRMADRTLQKFRRNGWATFRREGRQCIWSLTDEGRAALKVQP